MTAPLNRRSKPLQRLAEATLIVAAAFAAVACQAEAGQDVASLQQDARPPLGLVTSLPIYWGEPAAMSDLLQGADEPHRVRARLEEEFALVPLDLLGTGTGMPQADLAELDHLLVAQPRALTAADNVALDRWVRAGGRLLLVLDPMMTEHSGYAIGDARRFNDVALVPPVLARWGLAMRYAEGTAARQVTLGSVPISVEEFGILRLAGQANGNKVCTLMASGVMASCRIGAGEVLIVADAAFLNEDADSAPLDVILATAFG